MYSRCLVGELPPLSESVDMESARRGDGCGCPCPALGDMDTNELACASAWAIECPECAPSVTEWPSATCPSAEGTDSDRVGASGGSGATSRCWLLRLPCLSLRDTGDAAANDAEGTDAGAEALRWYVSTGDGGDAEGDEDDDVEDAVDAERPRAGRIGGFVDVSFNGEDDGVTAVAAYTTTGDDGCS